VSFHVTALSGRYPGFKVKYFSKTNISKTVRFRDKVTTER